MTFEQFLSIITNISLWSIAKIFVLLALLLYLIFAWLVIRQVDLMGKTLAGTVNLSIRLIAWLQLILVMVIFLAALLIL